MKRFLFVMTAVLVCLSSCAARPTADSVSRLVSQNADAFTQAALEMRRISSDRLYVAVETPEEESAPCLVRFVKESDPHEPIENDLLFSVLQTHGFARLFFQTASDGRQCVIFSYTRENDPGIQNGFYYSFDGAPCAYWGRAAKLEKQKKRFVQLTRDGTAAYYTAHLIDSFYYFEKTGSLSL